MLRTVAELDGASLDAMVALLEGWRCDGLNQTWLRPAIPILETYGTYVQDRLPCFSDDWEYGGRIVERERIALFPLG